LTVCAVSPAAPVPIAGDRNPPDRVVAAYRAEYQIRRFFAIVSADEKVSAIVPVWSRPNAAGRCALGTRPVYCDEFTGTVVDGVRS
jgi:hypothetical protein